MPADHRTGYDPATWGSMRVVKVRAAEILARYPATRAGLAQALTDPDFQQLGQRTRELEGWPHACRPED